MEINLGRALHDEQIGVPLQQFVKKVEEEPRLGVLNEFFDKIPDYIAKPIEGSAKGSVMPISDDVEIPESAKNKLILRPKVGRKPYSYIAYDEASNTAYFIDTYSRDVRAFDDVSDLDEVVAFGVAYMRYLIHDLFSESDELCTPEQYYS